MKEIIYFDFILKGTDPIITMTSKSFLRSDIDLDLYWLYIGRKAWLHSLMVTDSIVTSSRGTSWCMPDELVGTSAIASTTSIPFVTAPKTA